MYGYNLPARQKNSDVRPREYLTPAEVDDLVQAAKKSGRHGLRDALMILMCFRHALRARELVNIKWVNIDLSIPSIYIIRQKGSVSGTQSLYGPELRLLRPLRKNNPHAAYVFMNERNTVVSTSSFSKIVARAGKAIGFDFLIHPHMLRHACGYDLGDRIKDQRIIQTYLGHKDINHTTRYTELSPKRFSNIFPD